jgi:BRCT domain type II-containing protein
VPDAWFLALSDSQPLKQSQKTQRQPSKRQASKPSTQARQAKNDGQSFTLVSDTKKSKANPARQSQARQKKPSKAGLVCFL